MAPFAKIATWCTFRPRPLKCFPKKACSEKFLIFSQKNFFLNFGKGVYRTLTYLELQAYSEHFQTSMMDCFAKIATWRTFRPQPTKVFPKKTCSEKVSYIFLKKVFLIFWEKYIQNHGIFRTRSIFRTLSNIYDGTFCKNSYLAYFSTPNLKNFFLKKLALKKILIFPYKKFFLYFGKGIFRTPTYLELEAYSEHCQASMMDSFAKIPTWRTFRPPS